MKIQIPRGTQDILPGQSELWQYVEKKAQQICHRYHYDEIRTPIFEHTELFLRSVGETTDIVQKEMYTFFDRGERSITLRPEGTASVTRAYVEHKLFGHVNQPQKLFYIGPMFRYERPQSGRMRQFVQFGVEALGSANPAIDAEVIALAIDFYRELGLNNIRLVLNSLGDNESRLAHKEALKSHFEARIGELCADCQSRLQTNPLRILDCKTDRDHELMGTAPSILTFLNDESAAYFEKVKDYLTAMEIDFVVDPTLVRGLDYYNHTAFEIMLEGKQFGAITTLAGGGRYNGLVEELGGPNTPGVGFAMSIERLLMALEASEIELSVHRTLDCYVITVGEAAEREGVRLLHALRQAGIRSDKDYQSRKIKAQFKTADRLQAKCTAILGENELEKGVINVKMMATQVQEEVPIEQLIDYVKAKLKEEQR